MKKLSPLLLLIFFFLTGCKQTPKIEYKFADQMNLFPCSFEDMDLIKEAVYTFEEFIRDHYSFKASDKLSAGFFNYLKNTEAGLFPMGEKFNDHIKEVFYALKENEALWKTSGDITTLNYDNALLKCIADNMKNENIEMVYSSLLNSRTLRPKIIAPTLRSYFNELNEDRAVVTYIALDMFYAKIFQFDLSLTDVELARQIRELNDIHAGHDH